MRKRTSAFVMSICVAAAMGPFNSPAQAENVELPGAGLDRLLSIRAYDGVELRGRLRMPSGGAAKSLVIYVNGSGPNTYDDRRQLAPGSSFSYFDLFAQELGRRGLAFFSYDTRGVTASEEPPLYQKIDEELYKTYLPSNEIRDVESFIRYLRSQPGLEDAKVVLLGWSAGTAIAPRVALLGDVRVDALALCGYVNGTMDDTLEWQHSGEPSMIFYRQYFDADKDSWISRAELEADPYGILPALGMNRDKAFDALDVNADGRLDAADFAAMLAPDLARIRQAVAEGDDAWLATNYGVRLTSGWFKDYERSMPPNAEVLPRLDIPIHVFHGELDRNVPIQGARDIAEAFSRLGKDNLRLHAFAGHDHDLNYLLYPIKGQISPGLEELFDTLGDL